MRRTSLLILALLATGLAHASPNAAAKAQYQAAAKAANVEYSADKKLCADLGSGGERLQCLKDSKAKYTAAVKTAQAEMNAPSAPKATVSKDVGKVVSVRMSEKEGEGGALGVIAGGLAGGLLGNQVGAGTGRDLATIAGAAGGAYAGHKVEQKMKTSKVWTVTVRFNDGQEQAYTFDHEPGLVSGDTVKRTSQGIVRQ